MSGGRKTEVPLYQKFSYHTFCMIISMPSYFAMELCDINRDCNSVVCRLCKPVEVRCVQPRRSSNLNFVAFLSNLQVLNMIT